MQISHQDQRAIQNVLPFLRGLSSDSKLELAELLIELVRSPKEPASIESLFGAWESDKSAEEIIEEIYSARTTNTDREDF
ncbi:MAG TPA: hypothetical protein VG537_06765 [Candidatus Kapabacteria bacterium]|jgi:hypothetical protein|nr:hypothetical protein [Candidatus Kapabacteria bacterium]